MIDITTETKNALHQPVKQVRARITWNDGEGGTTQEITSEDRLISMKKDAEGYYLKSTLRKITIVLTGTETNLLDQKITATVEVKTGANTWGSIPWGSFAITEANIDQDKGISTFTGYGGISALQGREYQSGVFTFPTTVGGLTRQLADYFGITINPEMKLLPPEYQRVTYLQSTGTQHIDTGIGGKSGLAAKIVFSFDEIPTNEQSIIGAMNTIDGTTYRCILAHKSAGENGTLHIYRGTAAGLSSGVKPTVGTEYTIESFIETNTCGITVNGKTTTGTSSGAFVTNNHIRIFALSLNNNVYGASKMKLKECKIYDSGVLVRYYLPCRRKNDNKPGLYDLVEGKFYTNAGSGDFTLGTDYDEELPSEYQQVEYLQGNGQPYITLDYKATSKTRVETELEPLGVPIDTTYPQTGVYGSWQADKVYRNFWTNTATPQWSFTPAVSGLGAQNVEFKKQKIVHDSKNAIIEVNGHTYTGTPAATEWESTTSFKIFRADVGSNQYSASMRLYWMKIYDDDGLVRDLVPCRRKNDNKPGLYDRITRTFYTKSGNGEFTLGQDTESMPNLNAPITEDLWANISGTTYRDVLEEIAGATGTIAVIGGGDDTLDFKKPPISEASETLTEANLITSKIGANWGKVSSVVLSRQPQNDNIVANDDATAELPAGKNLINPDKLPARAFEGTGTNQYYIDVPAGVQVKAGVTYTLSVYVDSVDALPYIYSVGVGATGYARDIRSATSTSTVGGRISLTFTPTAGQIGAAGGANLFIRCPRYGQPTTYTYKLKDYQLELGETATAYEEFIPNGLVPLTIANNQILDKQRETTAQPILNAVRGWNYRNAEIKTEGHGYHEIGDRLDISVAGETYPTIVTKSTILVDGGISETLTSRTPEAIPINYAKSGGISKTVYRTELEVDKQEQRIDSIVSRQDATDAAVQEQFTQVTQNINSIVATAQASGGGNLIMNSVGFGKDSDGKLTVWEYGTGATTTTVRSQSSPASLNAGAVSGHEIMMTGASTISQTIALTPGEKYTLALRASKGSTGSATITLGNTSETATITLAAGTAYAWSQESVEFTPTIGANTLTITVAAGTVVEITDLILATGGAITWRQASGEIYNTQVSLDQGGVQVRSSVYTGDYVEITPLEFAGYSNAGGSMQKVFSLNRDTTEVEKLEARSQIKMPPIKIVPIDNASYEGWAFVKED